MKEFTINWCRWAVVVCLCALSGMVQAATSGIALKNAGFERMDDHGRPVNWIASSRVFSVDASQAHAGKASLKLHNVDANDYQLCTQTLHLDHARAYRLSGWVRTKDIHGSGATIAVEWMDAHGKWLGGSYSPSIKSPDQWAKLETGKVLLPDNAASVRIVCFIHPKETGTAWFDDLELRSMPRPILRNTLLWPNYRGRITAGSDQPIQLAVWLAAEPVESGTVVASLVDHDGIVVQDTHQAIGSGRRLILNLSIADIVKAGRYTLNVQFLQKESRSPIQIETYPIRVLAAEAPKPAVWIDRYNRLIVHGDPFMPIGLYMGGISDPDARLLADSPFNCVMPYARPTAEMLQRAALHGFYVIASLKDLYFGMPHPQKDIKNHRDAERIAHGIIRNLRDEPALLAWYTNDELNLDWMPKLKEHYRWVTEMDSNHPAWMVLFQYTSVRHYMAAFDAIGTDPYPIPQKPVSTVRDWTQTTISQVAHARPVWEVIQTHNLKNYNHKIGRTPSPAELRNMVWQAVNSGANGIMLYSLFDMQRNPDRPFKTYWPKVKAIAAELAQWAPVLLSTENSPKVQMVNASDASWLNIRTATWQGRTFVFASNSTRQSHKADLQTTVRIGHVRTIDVLHGGKQGEIAAVDGVWSDVFEPLAVRMYELDGTGETLPPPQDVHPSTRQ